MDVAEDLGSLWLKSEERGAGTTPASQSLTLLDEPLKQAWADRMWRSGMLALATCCGLALGYAGASVSQQAKMRAELKQAETKWRQEADESIANANSEIAELKRTLAMRDAELAAVLAAKTLPPKEATAESATVPQSPVFKAESRRNSIGLELVRIPKSEFLMGSPPTEKGRKQDESQVRVLLSQDFLLGKTEVTRGQWQQIMDTTPWSSSDGRSDGELPAVMVSWEDATEFCKKLTDRERASGVLVAGEQYRLPTEAEWEYACRAGTTTSYSFGDDDSDRKSVV
jgi:formylglycine-generating enzyme required for sulfatase activity